jgi:hypothetical protein
MCILIQLVNVNNCLDFQSRQLRTILDPKYKLVECEFHIHSKWLDSRESYFISNNYRSKTLDVDKSNETRPVFVVRSDIDV